MRVIGLGRQLVLLAVFLALGLCLPGCGPSSSERYAYRALARCRRQAEGHRAELRAQRRQLAQLQRALRLVSERLSGRRGRNLRRGRADRSAEVLSFRSNQ